MELEVIIKMRLVLDGLKLQPCSPTFGHAITIADQATGGKDFCLIWEVLLQED
jgi:hypothetical protein